MGWQLVHALIITIIHPFWAPQSIFIFCGFFCSLLPCHSRSLGSGIVCVPFIFSFFTFMCGIFPVEALICLFLHFAESLRICQLVCMYVPVFVSWLLLFLFGFICCLYTAAEIILQQLLVQLFILPNISLFSQICTQNFFYKNKHKRRHRSYITLHKKRFHSSA